MNKRAAKTKTVSRQKKSASESAPKCICDEYFRAWKCLSHGGCKGTGWIPEDGNALRKWSYARNVLGHWIVIFHDGLCCEVPTENKAKFIVAEFNEALQILGTIKASNNSVQ